MALNFAQGRFRKSFHAFPVFFAQHLDSTVDSLEHRCFEPGAAHRENNKMSSFPVDMKLNNPVSTSTQENRRVERMFVQPSKSARTAPTMRSVFLRLSGGADTLTLDSIANFAKKAGIGGFLGGTKRKRVAEEFMKAFDVNKDGVATWDEVRANAEELIPGLDMFDRADVSPKDGLATAAELRQAFEDFFREQGKWFPGTAADIATKITLNLSAGWKDGGRIVRKELAALIEDIEAQSTMSGPRRKLLVPPWIYGGPRAVIAIATAPNFEGMLTARKRLGLDTTAQPLELHPGRDLHPGERRSMRG